MNRPATKVADSDAREQTVRQLLQDCARRDARALERLYTLTAPALFALLTRMLRRRAVAEEALQDVYVSVWQRADQYRSERGSALAWLTGIARYRAIDLLRHERSAPVLMPELPESAEPAAGADAHDGAESTNSVPLAGDQLERCIGQLSGEQQRCLQFAYLNGRSHQEISQLTGSALGTVKSWIRRALFSLRECLES